MYMPCFSGITSVVSLRNLLCMCLFTLARPVHAIPLLSYYITVLSVPALSHDKGGDYISVVYVHSHSFTGSLLLA